MSYILDALERSEAERRRGEAPDLLARQLHQPLERPRNWPALAAAIVAVNLVVLGGISWLLLRPAGAPESAQASAVLAQPVLAQPVPAQPVPAQPVPAQAVAAEPAPDAQPRNRQPAPATPNPAVAPATVAAPVQPRARTQVPAPELDISSHIWSEYPDLRAVTINGKRLQEGATIRPGVVLREITETGVVVSSGGADHELDVLGGWEF